MNLQHLLHNVNVISTVGNCRREILGIAHDHRLVAPCYVFICYKGVTVDGHEFIGQALQNGAGTIVGEHPPTRQSSETRYLHPDYEWTRCACPVCGELAWKS